MKLTKKKLALGALVAVAAVAVPVATVVSCGKDNKETKPKQSTTNTGSKNNTTNPKTSSQNKNKVEPIFYRGVGWDATRGGLVVDSRTFSPRVTPNMTALLNRVNAAILDKPMDDVSLTNAIFKKDAKTGKVKFQSSLQLLKKPIAEKLKKEGKIKLIFFGSTGKKFEQWFTEYQLFNTIHALPGLAAGMNVGHNALVYIKGAKAFKDDYKFSDGLNWRERLLKGIQSSNSNKGTKWTYTDPKSVVDVTDKHTFFSVVGQAIDMFAVEQSDKPTEYITLLFKKLDSNNNVILKELSTTYILRPDLATELLVSLYEKKILQTDSVIKGLQETYKKAHPGVL